MPEKNIGKIEPKKISAKELEAMAKKQRKGTIPAGMFPGMKKPPPPLFSAVDAPLKGLTAEELKFANEVEAALARKPGISVRILSLAVFIMFACMIFWAWMAEIDEVTHADGQVVGARRTQTIQNLEGGILREILVQEGQIVEKGAVLAYLDNEMAESAYRDAVGKAIENSLALIRLEAESRDEKPEFPKDIRRWLSMNLKVAVDDKMRERARQLVIDQERAFESDMKFLDADIEVLKSQYEQKKREVSEQKARESQLVKSLSIARQQLGAAGELLRRQTFARMEYLNLEQKAVDLKGQIDSIRESIPRAEAAAEEAQRRIVSRRSEKKQQVAQEIARRRVELASLKETISAGGDRVTRTNIVSPTKGTVKQIHINTVGGVVKPGEPIMDITPLDDTLLVEAKVKPQDVAFLHPGQRAIVKVSAYDFSIYGGLEGKLESVSADTVENNRGEVYYIVKVRTPGTRIIHNGEVLPIIPGMMVTADIMIGKKTVLDYLVKPIMKAKQNALRER